MNELAADPLYQIHHYPARWIETRALGNGGHMTLRPVLPQDELQLGALVAGLSPQARRNRFHGVVHLSAASLHQMSCVDYRHQLALVVTTQVNGCETVIADARYCVADGDDCAEFAVMVDERWQRHGIGTWTMRSLQLVASHAGLHWLQGDVLQANTPMLALMRRHGFVLSPDPEDECLVCAQRRLGIDALRAPPPRRGLLALLKGVVRPAYSECLA